MPVYLTTYLDPKCYNDSDFQTNRNCHKSTSKSMSTLGDSIIGWRNIKQSCIVDFTMEVESIVACEAIKETCI